MSFSPASLKQGGKDKSVTLYVYGIPENSFNSFAIGIINNINAQIEGNNILAIYKINFPYHNDIISLLNKALNYVYVLL